MEMIHAKIEWLVDRVRELDKRPRYFFMIITLSQLGIGGIIFCLGLSAFSTSPQYRVGGFWAGLTAIICGSFRLTVLLLRLAKNDAAKKRKSALAKVMVTLSCICVVASVGATIQDSLAAFLIQQTDFKRCMHTKSSTLSPCDRTDCTDIRFSQNTCFCCYIMEGIGSDCKLSLLTGRQFYYSEVDSCTEIAVSLLIQLIILAILHVLVGLVSIVGMCKTSPITSCFSIADNIRFSKLNAEDDEDNVEHLMSEEELNYDQEKEHTNKIINSVSTDSVL